ncbi:organic cation transporter protein-like isoform X3 [Ornithodoros turicata]|uniref:organic cation transporter protein-like isoform X3 n=1 Tax=Ornithodoros turicata TaxID=34597 RepID=UPI0031399613
MPIPNNLVASPSFSGQTTPSPSTVVWIYKKDLGYFYGFSGPFQWNIFYFMLLVVLVSALHTLLRKVFIPELDYWCSRPPGLNVTDEQWKNISIPSEGNGSLSKCFMKLGNGTQVACHRWEYSREKYTRTLLEEFDLVCGRQWMIHLLDIVFAIGALAADITMGKMGDRCGRYPVIYANVLLLLIAGLVTIFMHKFPGFVVCQFFVAFGLESMLNTGIVLLSEVTDSKDRCLVIVACFVVWGTAYLILLPLLGFLENWIVAQVSIMIPTMLLFVGLTVVVESPRFLIAVRNYEEAEAVIMYAVKKNRINQEWASIKWRSTLDDICHASPIGPTYPGVNTLLLDRNNRKLLKMTTCLIVSWFVTSLMDNVIHFSFDGESTESVTVDTVAVGLLVQLLAFGFTMLTVNRSGRCIAMSSGLFIAGVAHLLAVSLQHLFGVPYVAMAVLAASKVFTVGVSNVLYVYTVEIFPTVIRSRAFSACTLSGHIGGLVASLGAELKSLISHTMWIMLVLSFVCILNSALVLNLPETKDRDLPDNFDDIEDLFGPFKRIKRLSESRRISDAFRKRTTLDMNNASPLTPLSTTTSPSQEIISENRIQPKAPRIIMPSTSPHADLPR